MENVPSFQEVVGQRELTSEQQEYIEQFAQKRVATSLSTSNLDETEAERHLRLAYQIVGLEPPQIRWFDSPVAFALAPEPAPQSIETLIRTSVEARVATTIAESIGEFMWEGISTIVELVGQPVWYSVGRLAHDAVLESVGRESFGRSFTNNTYYTPKGLTRDDLEASLWTVAKNSFCTTARAGFWTNNYIKFSQRAKDSVQAYSNAAWLAFSAFFAQILGPHDLIHLARFNERVSGYCLGRAEAWLVRKPILLKRHEQSYLHAEDGMCMRYRDGWGFYAWRGQRVPEKLILHPEQVTVQDWLEEKDIRLRCGIQERIGHRRFAEMVGGFRVENGALMVDSGNGLEPTGYNVYQQDGSPRVCMCPQVLFQHNCKEKCPRIPACPTPSDVLL